MSSYSHILVINPGSTSTKIALCNETGLCKTVTMVHSAVELSQFAGVWGQFSYRLKLCQEWISQHVLECAAVVANGGLFRPLEGGVYRVNRQMLDDARTNLQGEHASNLGCALAAELARTYSCGAFVVDPVSVDEFEPLARYSGIPLIARRSLSHALNIHAAARWAAQESKIQFERSSFIIAHLGGGISIAPVRGGKIIDVNDAASDGPFSPERSGGLPLQQFISLCYSGRYTDAEVRSLVMGKGGLVAYTGTNSAEQVEKRIAEGDKNAREVYQAMAYQVAKEIGAMSTVLKGNVNAIILTGGVSRSSMLTSWIKERVQFIAPVMMHPGEDEMGALAKAVYRVLNGLEQTKEY